MTLEKSLDSHQKHTILQFDVQKDFDESHWGPIQDALQERQLDEDKRNAVLRLHACPPLILEIGGEKTEKIRRTRGLLQGVISSGWLSRMSKTRALQPLLDRWTFDDQVRKTEFDSQQSEDSQDTQRKKTTGGNNQGKANINKGC